MCDTRQTAVITGASSGIGLAYAQFLSRRGYDLILVARRKERLEQLAFTLEEHSKSIVTTMSADLASEEDLRRVQSVFHERKDISILVNNAGVGALGPTSKVEISSVENLVKVNVLALTTLSLAALAAFKSRGDGLLVNIASVIALGPSATAAAYSGSKAYVMNFSRSLEQEYAETSITVQTIFPGPIKSEFWAASGVSTPGFPEELFMTAETLVETAMRAVDLKEKVTFPNLPDLASWTEFEGARKKFYKSVLATGKPAARYAQDK